MDLAKASGNNDHILFWGFSLVFPTKATLFWVITEDGVLGFLPYPHPHPHLGHPTTHGAPCKDSAFPAAYAEVQSQTFYSSEPDMVLVLTGSQSAGGDRH